MGGGVQKTIVCGCVGSNYALWERGRQGLGHGHAPVTVECGAGYALSDLFANQSRIALRTPPV